MLSIKNVSISLILISIIMFIFLMTTIFEIPCSQTCIFLLNQLFLILIPGLAAFMLTNQKLPFVSTFCCSYVFGYAINILEYFPVKYTENYIPVITFPILIFILSCLIIYKKKNQLTDNEKQNWNTEQLSILAFLFLILFLNIYLYAYANINIQDSHHDIMWWIGNTVALKLNFPPESIFMSGKEIYYHYFSNIQLALFSIISGIDVKTLSLPLYTITKTIVMVGAVDYALNLLKLTDTRIKLFGMALVLLTTGIENHTILTYFHHTLFLPFGFDIGYAFGIIFLALLIKQFYKDIFDLNIFLPAMIFWFVCVGAKAPVASVLIVFAGMLSLYWLIKKQIKLSLSYGFSTLLIFLYVSYQFVGLGKVLDGSSGSWGLTAHSLSDYGYFFYKPMHSLLVITFKIFFANPSITILLLLSITAVVMLLKNSKILLQEKWLLLMLFLTTISGIILWLTVNAGGNSEMYYGMASFIPTYFFAGITYSLIKDNVNIFSRKCIITYKLISITGLIIGIVIFSFCSYARNGAIRTLSRNLKTIKIDTQYLKNMEPLIWLRENTPKNILILGDNLAVKDDNASYIYGIFTERKQYLEEDHMFFYSNDEIKNELQRRKHLINQVYKNDKNAIKQIKNEGINYIISTNEITPYFSPDKNYAELVTSNNKFRVFKIK